MKLMNRWSYPVRNQFLWTKRLIFWCTLTLTDCSCDLKFTVLILFNLWNFWRLYSWKRNLVWVNTVNVLAKVYESGMISRDFAYLATDTTLVIENTSFLLYLRRFFQFIRNLTKHFTTDPEIYISIAGKRASLETIPVLNFVMIHWI